MKLLNMESKRINFVYGGIIFTQIENPHVIEPYMEHCVCPICLKILRNPVECEDCESYYCFDCFETLNILDVKPSSCKDKFLCANKFLRDLLSRLKIRCEFCGENNIEYNLLTKHYLECEKGVVIREELIIELKEKNKILFKLSEEKTNPKSTSEKEFHLNRVTEKEIIQHKLVTSQLRSSQKLELYKTTILGNLEKFKYLIEDRNYPLFEEISTEGFMWTPLHYAMHYGKIDIIKYILQVAQNMNILEEVMKCKSGDNRCPLLCLIRSNSLNLSEKAGLLETILKYHPRLYISPYVLEECKNLRFSDSIIKNLKYIYDVQNKRPCHRDLTQSFTNMTDNEVRQKFITSLLSSEEKAFLYKTTISGDLEGFKHLMNIKKYPIFEEISLKGFFWTPLHYAMYYGKLNIISYILKSCESKGILNLVIRLKSSDNRCPLLCLIRSNSLSINEKVDLLDNILSFFNGLFISNEVLKEGKTKDIEKVLKKHNVI